MYKEIKKNKLRLKEGEAFANKLLNNSIKAFIVTIICGLFGLFLLINYYYLNSL